MKPISKDSPAVSEPTGNRKTLLYVEDEDENFEVAQLRLSRTYRLLRARNSREAIEALRTHADVFAILMDIQLSGSELDGIQLTRLLRGTLPAEACPPYARGLAPITTPIVFTTAYGARYAEEELLAVGGSFTATKPVDFLKLTLGLANLHLRQVSATLA